MKNNGVGGLISYFVYFWIFQIGAFIMFRLMGVVGPESSLKHIVVLFVILGIAYTGLFFIKIRGDRKRAERNENAKYETSGAHIERRHKKKK